MDNIDATVEPDKPISADFECDVKCECKSRDLRAILDCFTIGLTAIYRLCTKKNSIDTEDGGIQDAENDVGRRRSSSTSLSVSTAQVSDRESEIGARGQNGGNHESARDNGT